jgi:hypothetical protein
MTIGMVCANRYDTQNFGLSPRAKTSPSIKQEWQPHMRCFTLLCRRKPLSSFKLCMIFWLIFRIMIRETNGSAMAPLAFFSSQKAYTHMTGNQWTHPIFTWLWKSKCQPKHKVFFWLLLKDRLNTRALLRQRSMPLDSYTCDNCILQVEETVLHLFFQMQLC